METHEKSTTTTTIKCYPPAEAEYQQLVENSDFFFQKLSNFHSSLTTNFISPSVGGSSLDLHHLFVEVTSRGGLDQVISDRKWEEVVSAFDLPITSISKSFLIRKYYVSLLYHFEQVYFFRKSVPTIPITETVNRIPLIGSTVEFATKAFDQSTVVSHLPGIPQINPGVSLVGVINEKFDNGYVVSVNMGSGQLKGILYHIPDRPQLSWSPNPCAPQCGMQVKSLLTLPDPAKPKPTTSSDNFLSDHYGTIMSIAQGQDESINKSGQLWDKLSETDKQFYQGKGLQDQEHDNTKMVEYSSQINSMDNF